jgi:hypothetical protein
MVLYLIFVSLWFVSFLPAFLISAGVQDTCSPSDPGVQAWQQHRGQTQQVETGNKSGSFPGQGKDARQE